tara:strand:+ start:16 stop:474 length:459 start_codon:yes stop_codon:yes gene_type:complete
MSGKSIDDKVMWNTTSTNDLVKEYKKGEYAEIKVSYDEIIGSTVNDFEKTYPELSKEFQSIQQEQYELFAGKMLDYGLGNIALGSTLEEAEDIQWSLTGIWLRCNDKINRLKNMLKRKGKSYVNDEPMIDSFIDISNYGIIAQLVMRGKWKK